MLRQYLQGLQGVDLFGILSTIIFFVFFGIMVIHTMRMKKEDVSTFSRIPLEEEKNSSNSNNE